MRFEVALEDLSAFAQQFWEAAGNHKVFAFSGPMGAGKTTIISAICAARSVRDHPASPTFSIINEYNFRDKGHEQVIYHIDLYRLNGRAEVEDAGVEDCISSGHYCFVEWPEKADWLFDVATVHVEIRPVDATRRQVDLHLDDVQKKNSLTEQL